MDEATDRPPPGSRSRTPASSGRTSEASLLLWLAAGYAEGCVVLIAGGDSTCVPRQVSDKSAPLEAAARRLRGGGSAEIRRIVEGRANASASGRRRASPEAKTAAALSAEQTLRDFRNPRVKLLDRSQCTGIRSVRNAHRNDCMKTPVCIPMEKQSISQPLHNQHQQAKPPAVHASLQQSTDASFTSSAITSSDIPPLPAQARERM